MKLEVGKRYVCRNRPDIEWVEVTEEQHLGSKKFYKATYHYTSIVTFADAMYYSDGTSSQYEQLDSDLVAEYKPATTECTINLPKGISIINYTGPNPYLPQVCQCEIKKLIDYGHDEGCPER